MSGWSMFVRQTTVLCLLLAVALAVVLLTVTHQVQNLEDELNGLHRGIAAEEQEMHVLQAEFSYLAEPERLRRLASAHLGLMPVEPDQLGTFATLDQTLQMPTDAAARRGATAGVRVASAREHRR